MARKTFRKVITSKELIEKINPKNKKLAELFLKDKNRKCSDATIKNYTSDLNIFFCWVVDNAENKFFPDIKKFEFSDFFSFCVDELKWSGKRFARMRSTLSSLSECVIKYYDEEYPTFRNVINTVIEAIPKEAVREKTILEDGEVENLLNWLTENEHYADACLFALALYSGGRVSELQLFKVDTIQAEKTAFDGFFLETTEKLRTKGFGKAGKPLNKYVIKDLFLPYFERYMKQRQEIVERTGSTSDCLFLQLDGSPTSVNTFNSWIKKWERFLEKDLYFHCFRHYFVTKLTKLGLSDEIIISIVGWSSVEMKKIYTDIEDKDKDWSKDLNKLSAFLTEVAGD